MEVIKTARLVSWHWHQWATEATHQLMPWGGAPVRAMVDLLAPKFDRVTHLRVQYPMGAQDHGLDALGKFSSLTQLDLEDYSKAALTDEALSLLSSCSSIVRLHISAHPVSSTCRLSDQGVARLAELTGLKELCFSYCQGITDTAVTYVRSLTRLTRLGFVGCQITDEGAEGLAQMSHLQDLDLNECDEITDDGVVALTGLTGLTRLGLLSKDPFTSRKMSDSAVSFKSLPRLKELSLCGHFACEDVSALTDIATLASLHLWTCWCCTTYGLECLGELTGLKELVLISDAIDVITDEVIWSLGPLTQLTKLVVGGCMSDFSDEALHGLAVLPSLRELGLVGEELSDDGMEVLKDLTRLTKLMIKLPITAEGVACLQSLPRLSKLALYAGPHITLEGFEALGRLSALEELRLHDTGMGDDHLCHLLGLKGLTRLCLAGCGDDLTDAGLAGVVAMTLLKVLNLVGCHGLRGAGVQALAGLTGSMEMNGGDESMGSIRGLTSLTEVNVAHCDNVTEAATEGLRALPNLHSVRGHWPNYSTIVYP
ncbi:unnamed protein product [Ostreobium quekettii]|uniref:F-box/LRR-repeat protein 15-like leucin rich repeat domain-containing protein n=1 Tax=Ostreobium quekettii TaxID=121088 RepID=A0A8S1IYD2_9CHLO|nr:unnamed protein product [Ostreobium quekettii]|eukprot:evm.model.scf_96.3 EVM.evm.TU.scf_96.3   scf_96:59611-63563(+)